MCKFPIDVLLFDFFDSFVKIDEFESDIEEWDLEESLEKKREELKDESIEFWEDMMDSFEGRLEWELFFRFYVSWE